MKALATTKKWLACLGALAVIALGVTFALEIADPNSASAQSSVRPPAGAVGGSAPSPEGGVVPGGSSGNLSDADMWRKVRKGITGNVSIPDKKAGTLVQSQGEQWRDFRNGPLVQWGAIAIGVVVVLLALFFLLRGRIMVEHGMSGRTVERFNLVERTAHWLLAVSFIILGLTGLNITFGKSVLMPVLGKEAFATIAYAGKWLHNYVAFAFIAGVLLVLVLWIKENFPNKYDFQWLAQAGGLFSKGNHPPAKKFNAGQKLLFWLVILGGLSLAASGIALMFPFEYSMFSGTFAFLNVFGLNLPTELSPIQEMQYATLWHAIMAIFMIVVVIGHIYIGTMGMQGAFDAMGSGEVDENWAKEHHSIWAKDVTGGSKKTRKAKPKGKGKAKMAPAE